MKRKIEKFWIFFLAVFMFFSLGFLISEQENAEKVEKISNPGKYRGYSQPIYNEWIRTSKYVTVRDGTKLAVDIFRPSQNGVPVSKPSPLIWTHHRYHRARLSEDGKLITILDQEQWLKNILKHGYVIAAVDVRGGGASYGTRDGVFTPEEAQDAYDIIEWFAAQPWCDGNIGMYGGSYLGITQYTASGTAPPHLKAIMPSMAMFDLYSFTYPGGIYQDDFIVEWSNLVTQLDIEVPTPPVDEDPHSTMLAEAVKEHKANKYPVDFISTARYRNSVLDGTQDMPFLIWSPHNSLKEIKESGSKIAIYHVAGWYDMWPRDALTWFNNLENPQKIIITPWCHSHGYHPGWRETVRPLIGFDVEFDLGIESLRWYDYWLKGIDNGIMDEPPIYYFTMGAPEDEAWRTASQWPLPDQKPTLFYFHKGPSASINSANDGLLSNEAPSDSSGQDDYTVDYTTTSGKSTRWHNGVGGDFFYPNMVPNDEKALTYTSPPLDSDVEVTGHPVVCLWVSSTADDGDFFVYLEEVDDNGYSHYITEGVLRGSNRKLADPPYKYMELPYHRSFEEDIVPLQEGKGVKLVFDLHPTSNIFDAGHRIRVAVTCTDQNNFLTPELSPSPKVTLYRNSEYASYISLPVVSAETKKEAEKTMLLIIVIIVIAIVFAVVFLFMYSKFRPRTGQQ